MANDLDEKIIPPARGKRTGTTDFNRNRGGLYGGLPKTRSSGAPGAEPNKSQPPRQQESQTQKSAPTGR